jgi:hypothetical protein
MGTNLGPQFDTTKPLPGMENMPPAEPHEQTESQFHNRPDVMVHGRFVDKDYMDQAGVAKQLHPLWSGPQGFHAGTEKAAHDRVADLAPAIEGTTARFFHGRVDPAQMRNQPTPGRWEQSTQGTVAKGDPGRKPDKGEDWDRTHHNTYYRNDYEDKGSTAAILPVNIHVTGEEQIGALTVPTEEHRPGNFTTWRDGITQAMKASQRIPAHVKALYEASGGESGPHHVLHTSQFGIDKHNARTKGAYATVDSPLATKMTAWGGHEWAVHPDNKGTFGA